MNVPAWLLHPIFGVAISVITYTIAQLLHRRWSWLHPLFVCAGLIILI
jgi:putative effector of murein hydrolase